MLASVRYTAPHFSVFVHRAAMAGDAGKMCYRCERAIRTQSEGCWVGKGENMRRMHNSCCSEESRERGKALAAQAGATIHVTCGA